MSTPTIDLSIEDFRALFAQVATWDPKDRPPPSRPAPAGSGPRGALRHLTPARVVAAARLVRTGVTVPLGRLVDTHTGAANPTPAVHFMTLVPDVDIGAGAVGLAKDYLGVDYHNDTHTHLEALCHVAFDGRLYGGESARAVTSYGSDYATIAGLAGGVVGRGVLLDIPRVRGVPWIEPGDHVVRADLEQAEDEQGVRVEPGDVLLVRTGHSRRLAELGPWDTTQAKAGLHPTIATFLAERGVAVLGSDGNNDTAPSTTEGVGFPLHVLASTALGIHLLDYLQFEDLVEQCEKERRWEFLCVTAPLRVPGGTGSPVNPLAIF